MPEIDLLEQRRVGADSVVEGLAGAGNRIKIRWINVAQDMVDDLGREIGQQRHRGIWNDDEVTGDFVCYSADFAPLCTMARMEYSI
ncbi:hypothetical protein RRF57_000483 [Xylaria bambusicola]|uniref:Uncharacterized protein n=1 Tax=Xylaria bambusicola TaxID=326684 RepID=A0AAN7UFS0_9PEZI